jgi:hypothetical protein
MLNAILDTKRPITISVVMTEEVITTEALRLHVADLAIRVQAASATCGIHSVRGPPRYQLAALALVDPRRVRASVRIGPDEFRRHFSEIRALVRIEDVPFGIVVRGDLIAVFQRHPTYRPSAADRYRAEFLDRQGEPASDLTVRVAILEATLTAVSAEMGDQAARISALEARASQ